MQTSEVDILKKEIALLRKLLADKDNGTHITAGQKTWRCGWRFSLDD